MLFQWILFALRGKRFEYLTVEFSKTDGANEWWVTNISGTFNWPTNATVGSVDKALTLMGRDGWEAYSVQCFFKEKNGISTTYYIYSMKRTC